MVAEQPSRLSQPGRRRRSNSLLSNFDRLFVGRDDEFRELLDALTLAKSGQGKVVFLTGELGSGKTTLARQLQAHATREGMRAVWARGHDSDGTPAYWPWIQVLRAFLDESDVLDLRTLPQRHVAALGLLLPELAPPSDTAASADAPTPRNRFIIGEAVTQAVRWAARQAPLLLVLDDLDAGDAASIELLDHLTDAVAAEPILLVGAFRLGDQPTPEPLRAVLGKLAHQAHTMHVHLDALSREAVADYLVDLTLRAPAEEIVDMLHARSGGNPFFLRELASHMLRTAGDAADSAEGLAVVAADIPESVRALLTGRLATLSPATIGALTAAAVIGRTFRYDLLEALVDGIDVATVVDDALQLHILEEGEALGEYVFPHALLRDAILESTSRARRAQIHARAATVLIERYGTGSREHAAHMAIHFVEAAAFDHRFLDDAIRISMLAAEEAERVGAWDEALGHYDRALTSIEELHSASSAEELPARIRTGRGRCLRSLARWREAWRELMVAIEMHRRTRDIDGFVTAVLEAVHVPAQPGRHLSLIEEALELLGDRDPVKRVHLLDWRASLSWDVAGQAAEEEARRLADEHQKPEVKLALLQRQARRAVSEMRLDAAADLFASAHREFANERAYLESADAARLRGDLLVISGDLEVGADQLSGALAYARRYGIQLHEQLALASLAGLALARGDFREVERIHGELPGQNYWRDLQAAWVASACTGVPEELDYGLAGHVPDFAAILGSARARMRLLRGDDHGARDELDRIRSPLFAPAVSRPVTHTRLPAYTEADEALSVMDEGDVRAIYQDLIHWKQIRLSPYSGRSVDALRGLLAAQLGDWPAASRHFRAGLAFASTHGLRLETARIRWRLAEVARRQSDLETAADFEEKAINGLRTLGAEAEAGRAQAHLAQLRALSGVTGRTQLVEPLTLREVEVLSLIATGRTNNELAKQLQISPNTVSHHVTRILAKLGAQNRTEAVNLARRLRVIDLP